MVSPAAHHRAWRPAWMLGLVLGLTPRSASAAPPEANPDPDPAVAQPAEAADADEQPRPSVAPPIVVGAVALGSLTTAIVFTARSARASRSLAADLDARVQYDQDDRRLHEGRRDGIVAATMIATTAVVGVLAVVCALRPLARAGRRRSSVAAGFGPHGGALVLTVGF